MIEIYDSILNNEVGKEERKKERVSWIHQRAGKSGKT
jgi:hypothetical protein